MNQCRNAARRILIAIIAATAMIPTACAAPAGPPKPEAFYDAKDAVVSLVADGKGGLFALCSQGKLIHVTGKNTAVTVIDGVTTDGWTWPCLALRKDGSLMVSDYVDKNSAIEAVGKDGVKTLLLTSENEILAMATDSSNNIYYSCFVTGNANITMSFSPSRITAAEFISGEIWKVDAKGAKTRVYEGGLPMGLAIDSKGTLYASLWGVKGAFSADNGDYAVADPRHTIFVHFGRNTRVAAIDASGAETVLPGNLLAISAVLSAKPGILLAYGMEGTETTGFYAVREKSDPASFLSGAQAESLTACCVAGSYLYFSDTEGAISRVSLASLK